MYVGKKGPVFELISCLRDARSNGRETISLFKYPIHVFVHFCPTWARPRQGLGNGSRWSRAGDSVVVLVKVGRLGSVVSYWSRLGGSGRAKSSGGRGARPANTGGGSKLGGERPMRDPVNFSHVAGNLMVSGERITT